MAKKAGVNRATVSLALRDHRSIPPTTCQRIKKIAQKLGYRPDPVLSALASYRHGLRPSTYHGTLAWLANTTKSFRWRGVPHFRAYHQAATERALRYGYKLEIIDVGDLKISWARAAALAEARGINGLLLCPQPEADTDLVSFPWDRFSAITFGYTLKHPSLHTVAAAQYSAVLTTVEQLRLRGYRRLGFAATLQHDLRVNHNLLAAYLTACRLDPTLEAVEPFLGQNWGGTEFQQWLKLQRIDGLITCDVEFLEHHRRWASAATRPFGVAVPMLHSPDTILSGVWERNEKIADAAVDFLVGMIQRGETGVPTNPQRVLIEGTWLEGETLRPFPAKAESTHTRE